MRFELGAAGYFYTDEEAKKLRPLGFEFFENTSAYRCGDKTLAIRSSKTITIEIDKIEELKSLIQDEDFVVSFYKNQEDGIDGVITIYNDYME